MLWKPLASEPICIVDIDSFPFVFWVQQLHVFPRRILMCKITMRWAFPHLCNIKQCGSVMSAFMYKCSVVFSTGWVKAQAVLKIFEGKPTLPLLPLWTEPIYRLKQILHVSFLRIELLSLCVGTTHSSIVRLCKTNDVKWDEMPVWAVFCSHYLLSGLAWWQTSQWPSAKVALMSQMATATHVSCSLDVFLIVCSVLREIGCDFSCDGGK